MGVVVGVGEQRGRGGWPPAWGTAERGRGRVCSGLKKLQKRRFGIGGGSPHRCIYGHQTLH